MASFVKASPFSVPFSQPNHAIHKQTDSNDKARPAAEVAAMVRRTQKIITIIGIAVATAFQKKVDFEFCSSTVITN